MTTTERPEIGQSALANGIRTNYLEDGKTSEPTVMLVHGSGPGVTSYANWRLVIPALAERFHVVAPDMVGFGYSDRPEGVKYSLDTWADQTVGLMDATRHREGAPRRQQLRRRHRAAHRHQTSRPGRQARADGQHGRALPDHRGPGRGVGLRRHARGHAPGDGLLRVQSGARHRRAGEVRFRGQHPARVPGVVLVDVPRAPPALGGGDVRAGGRDPRADRTRP